MHPALFKWLSLIWPIREARIAGKRGPIDLTWENGRRVVNTSNANQSYGALHRVWRYCFDDLELRRNPPRSVLILGFGGGSAARILRQEMGLNCHIVGVDDDPAMLELARNAFGWKNAAGVELHLADATTWIHQHSDRFELIVVDLFDDRRFIDGILDPLFLKGLAKLVGSRGHILLNTMVFDEESRDRSARLGQELRLHFNQVNEARYDGNNRVFIALWTGT